MTLPLFSDHLDRDWQIRLGAMQALRATCERTGGVVTRSEMSAGFEFAGERIPFANRQVGIWRPKQLARPPGIALSITTVAPKKGMTPRYDDDIGSDGWFEYRYQGTDPNDWDNRAVRAALEHRRPLIYFYGVAPGLYEPIFPAYVVADDPARLTFSVAQDAVGIGEQSLLGGGSPELLKAYATRTVKQRLHQARFRELVLDAYQQKCTVCSLGTTDRLMRLLDAAHILADHDQRGLPEIPNGLSLCKIHHSAYDLNILGISPDHHVHVRQDVLTQVDGPMLLHGIQEMAGREILLPSRVTNHPNKEFLAERFEGFRAA
jgi:putative restriction endonuclease